MQSRVDTVRQIIKGLSAQYRNFDPATCTAHLEGVAAAAALLAARRDLNAELATIAGLLHDVYAYCVGDYACHAHNGAEMARVLLRDLGLFTDEERVLICSAIFQHDDLEIVHGPYDEVLKDADILFPLMQTGARQAPERRRPRIERMAAELSLSGLDSIEWQPSAWTRIGGKSSPLNERMADLAESLAHMKIVGEIEDKKYLDLIRYWPGRNVAEELASGWCAAFVYHVAMESGLVLPIRHPLCENRFACVQAWVQWAMAEEFYHKSDEELAPKPGDIVIYDDVLPVEKKPEGTPWHDHIGIIVRCERDTLYVAEGNAEGENVSGVIQREKGQKIGGYIRIPDTYRYDATAYTYDQCVWGKL